MIEVYNYIASDLTFMNQLPGGFYYGGEIPYISRQYTPDAFDSNRRLLECAILQHNEAVPAGPPYEAAVEENFSIFIYSADGTAYIDTAKTRLFDVLHDSKINSSTGYSWYTEFLGELPGWWDNNLVAWAHISRWRWMTNRR